MNIYSPYIYGSFYQSGSTSYFKENLGVGFNSGMEPSAKFEVSSTSQGVLFPRMTLAQKNMIPMPATSLLVYQTDGASGYQYYDGSNWNNFVTSSNLTGYVTTNTTQTVTGTKTFNNVPLIKKTNTSAYPSVSGGFYVIGPNGSYDSFEFYSLDGSDQDSFGSVQIYSNPEEGNIIYHNSLDNQQSSILRVNYGDTYLRHIYGGMQTSLYVNGITDKIIIEGTQNKFAALGTALITGTKNFEFPDKSGTLALTSDISGTTNYIPKFIGTTSLGNSRIFDNGTNVGIGTITPNAPIDISHNNASYGSGINITNTNTSGTAITSISFTQNSPTGYKNGSINLFNDGRMDFLSNEGTFNFRAKSSTSSNAVAMYIDNISSTSRVTIGPSNTASHPLRVTQQVSNVSIYADYDIVAFSDQSVKENIRPIKNVIERIENSRGILYDRVDSGSKDNIGFIAQELEQTFPELVTTNEDGTKAVKYQNAVAVLFEGIKEQQKQIDELKDMITKLINDK